MQADSRPVVGVFLVAIDQTIRYSKRLACFQRSSHLHLEPAKRVELKDPKPLMSQPFYEADSKQSEGFATMLDHDALYFEDLKEGDSWRSPSRVITTDDVLDFANLTGDRDPLHVDPVYAANTPFRQPIAHGLLGLSFMAGLSSLHPSVRTTAFLGIHEWQFLKPIFIGDSIYVVTKIVDLQDHGRKNGMVRWFRQVLNGMGQVVQQGGLTTIVAKSGSYRRINAGQPSMEVRNRLDSSTLDLGR